MTARTFNVPGGDPLRGSGRSTQQIKDAPLAAVYVCPFNGTIDYHRGLATALGRTDLTFISVSRVQTDLRGLKYDVVVDHAATLTPEDWDVVHRTKRPDTGDALYFYRDYVRLHKLVHAGSNEPPAIGFDIFRNLPAKDAMELVRALRADWEDMQLGRRTADCPQSVSELGEPW